MKRLNALLLSGLLVICGANSARAQDTPPDLTARSLEDLMNIEVTSVSKKEQKLSDTASAIFVITTEDIRRSGATNIPDLLRMVPGVDVAQINANVWAITARGFNGEFADKLLVLLDGRSVYLPTFSGVFWDVLDLPLEDIERIEVIRGPGGTTWGTGAVNGVVNIITKKSSQTRGGMVVAEGGNLTQGAGTVQYGGQVKSTDYRVFTKYFNQYHLPGLTIPDGEDEWHILRSGFRTDSKISSKDALTLAGDLYAGHIEYLTSSIQSFASPLKVTSDHSNYVGGGFIQADWNHRYSARSDTQLQMSFDNYTRNDPLSEERNTLNIDFQHHFAVGSRHDFVWGLGYRYSASATGGSLRVHLNPANLNTSLFSAFLQDEIALAPERLSLTVGMKLERNHYTGFDVMPSARLAWNITHRQTAWAAISRAVDAPAANDASIVINVAGFFLPNGTPAVVRVLGNPSIDDETLIAYEAGYRTQASRSLSVDVAAYFNSYAHVESVEPLTPFLETSPGPPHFVFPSLYQNLMRGNTRGLEFSVEWKASARWTLAPAYSFEVVDLSLDPRSRDTQSVAGTEGSTPRQWARLNSNLKLFRGLSWDGSANFVGRLESQNVPSYVRADTQLAWSAGESLSFSLVGQNLLRDHHLEFAGPLSTALSSYAKRSAYAKVSWTF